ncbi:tubulin monoglutamylase TTLL4-like [Neodiprion pinetum]|uniref:tubulin monoglutamylase TTLL4-like n=1 Tax=Neodiprion pinetum TaxID=441929 RepID=UPI001EDD0875|nr:tubulin monoglutamylase TTLL4-like isoform X1 [Neodiprion pinetum]XP_046464769.1 tubulin monoglutamylase TTLL4-like isoform X1 [Neodiprion pinetum]XP_046464770.1 tubulin monoglutamylase TTLL4-like isoform X1 [Neodiprion pinetum]XP_046464771.1 tubulin monoglutamylase TTLL4-like isoform X1 [Neodiprion pinetum]XP_046464772.1 tubulin monoglutamylase TTLL4-like isoform X1 [Neodiprion pinetum]XP_046464773.1 tubulin monoglutamylase TTLL4-like isoform X1 [Neodiprion pinetum]XP_046464774.1 tubulin 
MKAIACEDNGTGSGGKAVGHGVVEDSERSKDEENLSQQPQPLVGEAGPSGDETIRTPLRRSLFAHVAPYVVFQPLDARGPTLPSAIGRHLKWRMSPITPLLVRRTVTNSGYRMVHQSPEWCGLWGKHMKSLNFKSVRESQKVNHFPGTYQLGRKDRLWRNLSRMIVKYGKKEFGFVPRTFVLPQELRCFKQVWEKAAGREKWIIKPPASARGTGIRVVHRWCQIPKKKAVIVQQYLSKPMLIDGAKFDLRLYVLVTSFNPLRLYIYPDGLVRFASEKYVEDLNCLSNRFMHLTNYSINKASASYTSNDSADSCTGHKWTLKTLWSYLREKKNVDVDRLWVAMKDIVVKTMVSAEASIDSLTWGNVASRYTCYELFGVDILLDEHLKPWLLEVNISPSLQSSSPLDVAVKAPMIRTVFNIVGFQLPPVPMPPAILEEFAKRHNLDPVRQDLRVHHVSLDNAEKTKHNLFSNQHKRERYLQDIIEDLTPDDVRNLIVYEDELTQLESFEKIFPTKTSHEYLQYFEVPRYYNKLFDAWETKYADNRTEGITRLQNLCLAKYHLTQPAKAVV